jgi:hypothetical protein
VSHSISLKPRPECGAFFFAGRSVHTGRPPQCRGFGSWNQVTKCSASSAVSRKRGLPRWRRSRRVGGAHKRSSIGGQRSTARQRGGARVAPAQHCSAFASDQRGVPEFSPRRKAHSASLIGVGETYMGESLLLLSCGAAFITGLVIAAASLFG